MMSDSDEKKLIEESLSGYKDPLELQPHVRSPYITELKRPGNIFKILLAFFLVSLLAIIVGVVMLITLNDDAIKFAGKIRVLTPNHRFSIQENFQYEPKAITIDQHSFDDNPAMHIFHLLDDDSTVIQTKTCCYVRPLSPEVLTEISPEQSMIKQIQIKTRISNKDTIEANLVNQLYMISDPMDSNFKISYKEAAESCSHVPIFKIFQLLSTLNSYHSDLMQPNDCPNDCTLEENGLHDSVCRCPPEYTDSNLFRPRRHAPATELKNKAPLEIPNGCVIKEHLIEGALPTNNHATVTNLTILSCRKGV